MCKFNVFFLVLSSLMVFTKCAVVSAPIKCSVTDGNCKRLMYQKMFKEIADGAPSVNIPKSDPLKLQKMIFSLPNSLKLTIDDGIMSGIKTCEFDEMETILEEPFHSTLNITCDLEINGQFTVDLPKSVIKEFGGETSTDVITGSGRGKMVMERLHLYLLAPFDFEWRDNDIYVHAKHFEMYHDDTYMVDISIDGMEVGNTVESTKISNYLTDHAVELKLVSPIAEVIRDLFQIFVDYYVSKVPAKDLYVTDISSLA